MYDAIVVGARCAGSATALALAKAGRRVLLVDKVRFPSDTMSTLFLQPAAMTWLARHRLLDAVHASGCPPMTRIRFMFDDVPVTGFAWSPDRVASGYAPRRTVLDKLVVDAAVAAGAELREDVAFEDVVRDGDRVAGIRAHSKSGEAFEERARIVVGADGRRSAVARAVGAEMVVERPPAACWYYTFYSGVEIDVPDVVFRNGGAISAWPTNDGQTIVIGGWQVSRFAEVKADLDASFASLLEMSPELAARVRAGRREERYVGAGDIDGFVRRSHGPGWALVGDAGYHKDPVTAQGIADALSYGEKLGAAIHGALDGDLDAATAAYQRARDEAVAPVFDYTMRAAEMKPVAERTKVFLRKVADSPVEAAQLLGVLAGTVSPIAFFAPANIGRIMAG
jgi:flavin-dependent dehydrogenase